MPTPMPYAGPYPLPYGAFTRSQPFPTVPFSNAKPPSFVISGAAPVFFYGTTLSSAVVGAAYSQTLTPGGGTAPYTFTLSSGALPPGLSLSAGGVISGTPTAPGMYTFGVTATDSRSVTATQAFTITTAAASGMNSGYSG